ncbi:MAG: hypothetical protein ACOH5I_23075 [Oligoflexus sp.]
MPASRTSNCRYFPMVLTPAFRWILLGYLLVFGNQNTYAAHLEDWLASGLNARGYHLELFNPAITYDNSRFFSSLALRGKRDETVVGSPDGNLQNLSYKTKMESVAGGFLVPLGGAAFGLNYSELREELTAASDGISREMLETQSAKNWSFRFIIQLTSSLRGGFMYQIRKLENDIYGSFNLNNQDRTVYKSQLSGYRLGIFYDVRKFNLALYTAPPLRGKGTVTGEQKIMTEPGSAGADISFEGKNSLFFGLGFTRWYYKIDDRYPLSTSPMDQRSISLNGLALRQYLKKTNEFKLGASYEFRANSRFSFHYGQGKGVFLFEDDAVPGDRRNRETEVNMKQYILSFRFDNKKIAIDFSYYLEMISQGEITDPTWKLGHNRYRSYRSEQSATVLNFGIKN